MGQGLWPLVETEQQFAMSLYRMMKRGIKVDTSLAEKLLMQGTERMSAITELLGFSPSETTKLHPFLLDELQLPILARTPKGKPSFTKTVMEEYDLALESSEDNRAQQILEFRGWQKACSSFYRPYLELLSPDGRLRARFKMHGTRTGRLSCEGPNLQQIPREGTKPWNLHTKKCFIPQDGFKLIEFDYKTLEFRLAAIYAGDPKLIERINDGQDLHQATVDMIKESVGLEFTRQHIKTTNFLMLYGGGKDKLALQLGVKEHIRTKENLGHNKQQPWNCNCSGCTCSCSACITYKAWNQTFFMMRQVMQSATKKAKERGYVQYWSGRRKHYNTTWNRGAEHKAFNALCQGGGAEITKNSLVRLRDYEDDSCRPVLTVHDSLVWEIRQDQVQDRLGTIREKMMDYDFSVKMEVDAHVWGEG